MEQKKTNNNNKSKSGAKGKIITVELVAFAFLAVYLIGYTINMIKKPNIAIETVSFGQIDIPRQFDGLLVREEAVTFSDEAGTAVFSFSEKEYVKKNSLVCAVRSKTELEALEREIESINDSILTRALKENSTDQAEEVKRINSRMKNEVSRAVPLFTAGKGEEIYRFKGRLQKEIETRNTLLLSGLNTAQTDLVDKKTAFEKQLSDGTGAYAASRGGILSYSVDGMESVLTPESVTSITLDQITTQPPIASGGDRYVEKNSPLFKIVSSNQWYMCTYLDNEIVLDWKEGSSKPIYFNDSGNIKKIVMRITNIVPHEGKTLVVFSSSKYLLELINERNIKFSLEDDTYKGLKIPNTAITEKMALIIPSDFIYEYRGSSGIYVKENNGFPFKPVSVLSQKDGSAYVLQNFDSVKLGTVAYRHKDGKAIENESFTISEIMPTSGIYVANSGSAEFRQIKIVKRNDYYSIIESSTGYGVKSFDSIVSDSSSVTDNQIIR